MFFYVNRNSWEYEVRGEIEVSRCHLNQCCKMYCISDPDNKLTVYNKKKIKTVNSDWFLN